MKYTLSILLFFCISFISVNANYQIYFDWEYYSNIILNEELHKKIDSDLSYSNAIWYLNSNNNFIDISNNFTEYPIWFFSKNIKTIVDLDSPNFTRDIWFLGINNNTNFVWNINDKYPIWFFNNNIDTNILDDNPEYNLWVWFIEALDTEIKNKKKDKIVIIDITYKEFFTNLIKKESHFDYLKFWYKQKEYNLFINNIVSLLVNWNNYEKLIISKQQQDLITKNIKESDFAKNLSLLMNNLDDINKWFEYHSDFKKKKYIIKYFLD